MTSVIYVYFNWKFKALAQHAVVIFTYFDSSYGPGVYMYLYMYANITITVSADYQ